MAASFLFLGLISPPYLFFAVLAARLKFAAVGAPLEPGFRIFSPLPAFILLRLRWMFSYSPGLLAIKPPCYKLIKLPYLVGMRFVERLRSLVP